MVPQPAIRSLSPLPKPRKIRRKRRSPRKIKNFDAEDYEEELEKETSRMTQLDPRNLFTPAVIGNWGDMAMEEDEKDDEDYISTEYHAAEYTQQDGWYD